MFEGATGANVIGADLDLCGGGRNIFHLVLPVIDVQWVVGIVLVDEFNNGVAGV